MDCRDEDHLALFMELLGRMPLRVSSVGSHARDFFTHKGELRHIKKLHYWPMDKVLVDKYGFPAAQVSTPTGLLCTRMCLWAPCTGCQAHLSQHPSMHHVWAQCQRCSPLAAGNPGLKGVAAC